MRWCESTNPSGFEEEKVTIVRKLSSVKRKRQVISASHMSKGQDYFDQHD